MYCSTFLVYGMEICPTAEIVAVPHPQRHADRLRGRPSNPQGAGTSGGALYADHPGS